MNNKFAKIVEVDGVQVLFWRETDGENDGKSIVHQQAQIHGLEADLELKNIAHGIADNIIDKADAGYASEILKSIRDVIGVDG